MKNESWSKSNNLPSLRCNLDVRYLSRLPSAIANQTFGKVQRMIGQEPNSSSQSKSSQPSVLNKDDKLTNIEWNGLKGQADQHYNVEFFNGTASADFTGRPGEIASAHRVQFDDGIDTSHLTNLAMMFSGTNPLTDLNLGNNFDTSNVTSTQSMFAGDYRLKNVQLGNRFDMSKVTNMNEMFFYNTNLTNLSLGNHFDTSKVNDMQNMFGYSANSNIRSTLEQHGGHFNNNTVNLD